MRAHVPRARVPITHVSCTCHRGASGHCTTGRSSMYDEAVSLYVHRQMPRKSPPCLAYSWVRRFGVFGCRLVSPGSAIAIGSVKCERVWGSFVRAGAKNGARWSAFRGMGYACVPCARSKNEYFLRLARAARLATRATGRIRTRLKQQPLNDCYTNTMAEYVLSMVRSFSGYEPRFSRSPLFLIASSFAGEAKRSSTATGTGKGRRWRREQRKPWRE